MTRTKTEYIRLGVVAAIALALIPVTYVSVHLVPGSWGCAAVGILGDVSAILFGVFGIWLGMFYRPDVCDTLKGKSGDELERSARLVIENSRRFDIVFRGMRTSAAVLVFSMLTRTLKSPVMACIPDAEWAHLFMKAAFFYFVLWAMLLQCYAIIMSIVPMSDARKRMSRAKDDAEFTLSV